LKSWGQGRQLYGTAHNGLAPARQDGRVPRPFVPSLRGLCARDQLLELYPHLTKALVLAAIQYGAGLAADEVALAS